MPPLLLLLTVSPFTVLDKMHHELPSFHAKTSGV